LKKLYPPKLVKCFAFFILIICAWAIRDAYAESGTAEELLDRYRLTAPHIVRAAERVLARKKK